MAFKNYRIQIVLRVILLSVMTGLLMYCVANDLFLRGFYAALAVIAVTTELVVYIDGFNEEVKIFVNGLLQRDFTSHFSEKGKGKKFTELFEAMNKVTKVVAAISSQHEIQFRFLEMLVAHVRIGILSYDITEKINMMNGALRKLLPVSMATHLADLSHLDPKLVTAIRRMTSGETIIFSAEYGGVSRRLSLYASEFRLDGTYYKLISIYDIRAELELEEMEAWQKLMRVLTHEIMNSISPISSLSSTLLTRLEKTALSTSDEASWSALDQGLRAIEIRSRNLHQFAEAFRQLSRLPEPAKKWTGFASVFSHVDSLFRDSMTAKGIRFQILDTGVEASIDEVLLEQAIINLLRNAVDAVQECPDPSIALRAFADEGRAMLIVEDNGSGMSDDVRQNVFIPFFTTRVHGTGIGLSITRQIVQMHGGHLRVDSVLDKGTRITILFP